jgi:hypothetical protein
VPTGNGIVTDTPVSLVIGAGVFIKDHAYVGPTIDNNLFAVERTMFAPELNGILWDLQGTDYINRSVPRIEATVPSISTAVMGSTLPGLTDTATPGMTVFTDSGARRIADADYHDYELDLERPNGGQIQFEVDNAINTGGLEGDAAGRRALRPAPGPHRPRHRLVALDGAVADPAPRRRVLTMDLAIVAALALTLGLVLGFGAGAVRALRVEARRRAAAGASGVLAQVWGEGAPTRSPADVWAGRIRIVLGGVEYILPVAPRKVARDWLDVARRQLRATAALIEAKDVPDALRALAGHTDTLYDLLADYASRVGVTLPVRDSELDFASDPRDPPRDRGGVGCAPPFSRRARDERADEPDEWAVSGVYDFIAREFGWGRDYVDDVLSDEQLVAYLDAAQERLEVRSSAPSSTAGSKPSASARSSRTTTSSTAAGAPVPARAPGSSAASPAPLSSRP